MTADRDKPKLEFKNRRRGALAALTAALVVVAACSSSSTPTANSTTMKPALIRASDLPAGWQSSGSTSTSDAQTRAIAAAIPACADFVKQSDLEKSELKMTSDTFKETTSAGSSQNEASNQIVGYKDASGASTAYDVFASGQTETCLSKVFDQVMATAAQQAQQQSGVTPSVTSQVSRLSVPKAGDASTAYQVVVMVSAEGVSEQIQFVVELVKDGPYVVSYNATLYHPTPEHFGTDMVSGSIARLDAAMG